MLAVLIGLGLLGSAFVGFAQPENSNLPPETETDNEPPRPNEPIIVDCPIDKSGIGEKSPQEPKYPSFPLLIRQKQLLKLHPIKM